MASVNKVILIGNLGRDPETRYTAEGGLAICSITVATSRRYKDAQGALQEETEWHRVVLFGRQAEVAQTYLKKGNPVYIEGRLRTRKYTDKQGVERFSTEIVRRKKCRNASVAYGISAACRTCRAKRSARGFGAIAL